MLDSSLRRPPWKLTEADAAALHFLAAQMAIAASLPERAAPYLAKARQLARAFVSAPELHARFLRQTAGLYQQIGLFGDSTALLETVVDQMTAKDPAVAAEAANALGTAWLELRRPDRAITAFNRQLKLLDAVPPDRKRRVTAYVNLSNAELEAENLAGARAAWEGAVRAGEGDPEIADALDYAQAQILLRESRLSEAEELLQRITERPTLSDPALRGHAFLLLATARFNRGLLPEADRAAFAAAEAYEADLGEWHPVLGRTFHTLGTIQDKLKNLSGAASFYARALTIQRRSFGPRSVQYQATEIEQAWVDVQNGDLDAARRRATAALDVFRTATPPDRRREGIANILVGLIAEARNDNAEAVARFRTGQRLIAAAQGEYSPDLGFSLVRAGRLLTRMGRYNEAIEPLDRAVALYEHLGSAGTVYMADALAARAELLRRRGDRRGALEESRRAFAALRDRIDRTDAASSGAGEFQRNGARELFAAHVRMLIELDGENETARQEAFEATQEAMISRAADAIRLSTIRLSAGPGEVARLLRAREDAADALRQTDTLLRGAGGRNQPGTEDETSRLGALRREQADALRRLDAELAMRFPKYSEFINPRPVELGSVQSALAQDEALLISLIENQALIVWAITADRVQVRAVPVSKPEIGHLVERLRRGVDLAHTVSATALPSFDNDAAKRLYNLLISPVEAALSGKKHLLFVADGALQSISLHPLIGEGDAWLVRRFAITAVPSVRSLIVQRRAASPSHAERGLLGVGDPQLSLFASQTAIGARGLSRGLRTALASLPALPETAEELRRMAGFFPAGQSTLVLGEAATEQGFLDSSPSKYGTLAFSTHALMAGQLPGLLEPAIVLTPTDAPGGDGLLTASDIATLTIDADLVILSACNTAAPDGGPFADGFSGLARAFLHAGARTLLVSHWTVASDPTIELTTGFLRALHENQGMRKAEALRQSILRMLDAGDPLLTHPAFWAPFVVVGD